MRSPSLELFGETLGYHAARLLVILRYCGSPQSSRTRFPGIKGRTLLAKLDFFVRYPNYLEKAAQVRSKQLRKEFKPPDAGPEAVSIESHMVRYLYGPWDHTYFNVLAYLAGKSLVRVELDRGVEIFRLTSLGLDAVRRIADAPEYAGIVERAKTTASLFPNFGGTKLKDFIYQHFPEVVRRQVGTPI